MIQKTLKDKLMSRNLQHLNLQPADRIVVPKSNLRMIQHHAIYLGKDEFGRDLIAENCVNKGVQIVTAEDFFKDGTVIIRIEPFRGSNAERTKAINDAFAFVGTNYNLLGFNCEHYANVVQQKPAISKQVATGLTLAVVGLFVGVILNNE